MAQPTEKPERFTQEGGRRRVAPGKTPAIVRTAQRLGRLIPDEELRLIPRDLSDQADHYVYGSPKR